MTSTVPPAARAAYEAALATAQAAAPLRGYALVIHEATGLTDPADLEEVEDIMRHAIFHSTLDWQTRAELHAAAREGATIMAIMRDPAALALALAPAEGVA